MSLTKSLGVGDFFFIFTTSLNQLDDFEASHLTVSINVRKFMSGSRPPQFYRTGSIMCLNRNPALFFYVATVWLSANVVGQINEVTLRRAG